MGPLADNLKRIETVLLMGFVLFYVVLPLWAMRDGIAWGIKRGTLAILGFLVANRILLAQGVHPVAAVLVSMVAGLCVAQLVRARNRHIPAGVKRELIAKYESKTGKKYNPRQVEIDHRWPFAGGGSNTADNLRVISKAKNRRKGARRPKPTDWF